MAEHVLAVLVDFENMARPGAKSRGDFDIDLVLSRLAEKGRVVVKRAYADWSRYREAKMDLQNAGLELIEMPSAREGAKNRADIKLAVDAMELAYSREHVDNFVIVSGDSDFTPLVGKLRELNKRVIGMGNRESSSELLIANCDEFIFYDSIASTSSASRRGRSGSRKDPVALLSESLLALQRESVDLPLASVVKDAMRRKDPAFDENALGFSTFSKFLEASADKAGITLQTDPRSGTYRVSMSDATAAAATPSATAVADDDEGTGDTRRRRRRGRRGEGRGERDGGGERTVRADDSVAAAASGADVFEVFVTPTPDPDLGQLPSLDEPITYEDMVLLTPEVEAGVKAAGVEDDDPDAPPARSTRRRRRRASADADTVTEPTPDDLEAIADEDVAAEEAAEETLAEVGTAAAPEAHAEPSPEPAVEPADDKPASRRRVRRSSAATTGTAKAKATPDEAEDASALEAAAEEAPAEEKPKRRRAPRKKVEAAPAEDAATE
jgi:uncharacterized protein (TIGR00288 family)